MLQAQPLTPENLDAIAPLYQAFCQVAEQDYGWPSASVGFDALKTIFDGGLMHGHWLRDTVTDTAEGFLFYQVEPQGTLEIKMLYLADHVPVKSALDTMMPYWIEEVKGLEGWDVASFALLGVQRDKYTRLMPWYGFTPIGQAVVKFDLSDSLTVEIFENHPVESLPPGYTLIPWQDAYTVGVIEVLTEAFAQSVDALWDPRFRTAEGMKEALAFVTGGHYGVFWPRCSSILLNAQQKVVGVCLLNIVSPVEANIPLIGLAQSERRHKLGRMLLSHTVRAFLEEVRVTNLGVQCISATVATSNIPAIRMYRHTGFQEDQWYPHVYQDRAHLLAWKVGQWC